MKINQLIRKAEDEAKEKARDEFDAFIAVILTPIILFLVVIIIGILNKTT
ncbi:MAG: hypothetical protein LW595_06620 [Rickettsiales bacterium]|nr:hypothetical protein [Rickettsiales bacterium]